jgi:hypothetical protein
MVASGSLVMSNAYAEGDAARDRPAAAIKSMLFMSVASGLLHNT